MKRNAMKGVAAAMAALLVSACAGLDPMAERAKLEQINASLADSTRNWPAYQAQLRVVADDLAEIAGNCAAPGASVEAPELQALCYGVSAEAYSRLTDLPSGELSMNGEPALLARGVADRAEPVCAQLEGYASCELVRTVDATVGARRMASDLIDMAGETELADPDTAIILFEGFAEEVSGNWARAQGEPASGFKLDQACYVSWAANAMPLMVNDPVVRSPLSLAGRRAMRAAAHDLALNPCSGGEASCARSAPCEADPNSEVCIDRRVFALSRYCGPGVPSSGASAGLALSTVLAALNATEGDGAN